MTTRAALALVALAGCAADPPRVRGPADLDGDGLDDDEDDCPRVPEDLDDEEDGDGCPECYYADRDGDDVEEPADACPDDPEDRDGDRDEDGCPDP